jgi:hypothetical protein
MIYRSHRPTRTKAAVSVERVVTKAPISRRLWVRTERQVPTALIGLIAIGVIWAIHVLTRPPLAVADTRLLGATGCRACGTVVAVRRSAHSVPVTFVELKMADGSMRTVRAPAAPVSVGDVVEVRDDGLTPRDAF